MTDPPFALALPSPLPTVLLLLPAVLFGLKTLLLATFTAIVFPPAKSHPHRGRCLHATKHKVTQRDAGRLPSRKAYKVTCCVVLSRTCGNTPVSSAGQRCIGWRVALEHHVLLLVGARRDLFLLDHGRMWHGYWFVQCGGPDVPRWAGARAVSTAQQSSLFSKGRHGAGDLQVIRSLSHEAPTGCRRQRCRQ